MPLYGAEITGLSVQALNGKMCGLIPGVSCIDTIQTNTALIPEAVSNNALIPSAVSVIEPQEPEVNKPIDGSILNFFPYNNLNMPANTDLVFDKIVFLLEDNRKKTLDEAIIFFQRNFSVIQM